MRVVIWLTGVTVCFYMEDDAGALVRRLALKTRFSEMGWGSTPPSSAKTWSGPIMVLERIANPSVCESRLLGSSPSHSTNASETW